MTVATIAACLTVVSIGLGQAPAPAVDLAKSPAALQGTWTIESVNGQKLASIAQKGSIEFARNAYTVTMNGRVTERGTFKLDVKTKPTAIDMDIVEGVAAGHTQIGLVQVIGDTLTLKTNTFGRSTRPTDFTSQLWYVLIVAKKAKP